MGAWSSGIFGSDDAGDMSDVIGDFVGIDSNDLDLDCMACMPEDWDRKMINAMKTGFEANMDGFMEFISSNYKIRRKRFKNLTSVCSYGDQAPFGMILAALCMNAGAEINETVRSLGIAAAQAELDDKERMDDWNDSGTGRKRTLKAFIRKLEAYKGGRRVKIV